MTTLIKLFDKTDASADARIARKFLEPVACILVAAFVLSSAVTTVASVVAI